MLVGINKKLLECQKKAKILGCLSNAKHNCNNDLVNKLSENAFQFSVEKSNLHKRVCDLNVKMTRLKKTSYKI